MSEELERLIVAAEEASGLWRTGSDKAKRNPREIVNDLDAAIRAAKKLVGKESTRIIQLKQPDGVHHGE